MKSVLKSREGASGNVGNWSGPTGSYNYHIQFYDAGDCYAYFHRGVGVIKWEDKGIKLPGDAGAYIHTFSKYALNGGYFENPFIMQQGNYSQGNGNGVGLNQRTLTRPDNANDRFRWTPDAGKGVLSNWYNGCEPTSEVLSTLLGDGFFYGFPWTSAIGYAFRGNGVPRLIFVYTNEFDNSLVRERNSKTKLKNIMMHPSFYRGNVYLVPIVNSDEADDDGNRNPPDRNCFNQAANPESIWSYLSTIGLSGMASDELKTAVWNVYGFGLPGVSPLLKNALNYPDIGREPLHPNFNVTVDSGGNPAKYDLRGEIWSKTNIPSGLAWKVLSKNLTVPGSGYLVYSQTQTLGFYKLQSVVSEMTEPTQVYLFTSDGNAPNVDNYGTYPFVVCDYDDFFHDILSKPVPSSVGFSGWSGLTGHGSVVTWKALYEYQLWKTIAVNKDVYKALKKKPNAAGTGGGYYSGWGDKQKEKYNGQEKEWPSRFVAFANIFGVANLWKKTTIVFGIRSGSLHDGTPTGVCLYSYKTEAGHVGAVKGYHSWDDWMTNKGNCRYQLTQDTCVLGI